MSNHVKLDQHTLVPVGLAITVVSTVCLWAAHIQFSTTALADRMTDDERRTSLQQDSYRDDIKTVRETLSNIDHRLSIIEGELRRIHK